MIKVENNRFTSNRKNNTGAKAIGGCLGAFIDIKDTEGDCTITDCIFETRDDATVGVEYTMKDGIRLFYKNANGSTNEFRGFAIVPTEKFFWMESQMHWYRFKNLVVSIIPRMKCFWRTKILKRNPLWIMAKENHIRTYGDLK